MSVTRSALARRAAREASSALAERRWAILPASASRRSTRCSRITSYNVCYTKLLRSFAERRASIAAQLDAKAKELNATINPSEGLLDEVTALVEWPVIYVGEFEAEYLDVPQECLILTMQQNQKYFPLLDASKKLLNKFLIVSNMQVDDPKHIVGGNARVVRPRLSDARFFS